MYEDSPLLSAHLDAWDPPELIRRPRVRTIPYVRHGSGPVEPQPFPVDPVIDLCAWGRVTGIQAVRDGVLLRPEGEIIRTAEVLDVDRQRIYRWLRSGLSDRQADVIAVVLGLHACLVWPNWFELADDPEAAAFEAEQIRKRWEARDCPQRRPAAPEWPHTKERMAELRANGATDSQIARTMMDDGRLTRGGNPVWTRRTVRDSLRRLSDDKAVA